MASQPTIKLSKRPLPNGKGEEFGPPLSLLAFGLILFISSCLGPFCIESNEVGRHIIGYEVQKVLAAIDWFTWENQRQPAPIGLAGYGEGGLLALYGAALDPRITATLVSGYYQPREGIWREPIYRDVWGLLREFGDAELASLVAPRTLIVEACRGPELSGPPPESKERRGAAPQGRLSTPPLQLVQAEVERARPCFA